jgi:hypothetical protein
VVLRSFRDLILIETLTVLKTLLPITGPPLWASGQSSWLHNGDVL